MKKETLIQIASLAKNKPNKPQSWVLFQQIVRDIEQAYAVDNGGEIPEKTLSDLGEMYQFFKPAIPKNPKTKEQWLAKAMSKQDVRYYLQYLYSYGDRLVATDGHRLHILNDYTIKKGFYDSELTPCDVDATFPDVDRVIPNIDRLTDLGLIEIDNLICFDCNDNKAPMERFKLKDEHRVCFQGNYIRDAVSFMTEPHAYFDEEDQHTSLLIIDKANPNLQAVVMPMRI